MRRINPERRYPNYIEEVSKNEEKKGEDPAYKKAKAKYVLNELKRIFKENPDIFSEGIKRNWKLGGFPPHLALGAMKGLKLREEDIVRLINIDPDKEQILEDDLEKIDKMWDMKGMFKTEKEMLKIIARSKSGISVPKIIKDIKELSLSREKPPSPPHIRDILDNLDKAGLVHREEKPYGIIAYPVTRK